MCITCNNLKVGDKVKETDEYRVSCQDRDIRGKIIKIRNSIATVKNIHGWTYDVHYLWLEHATETKQNFCQHCGGKL